MSTDSRAKNNHVIDILDVLAISNEELINRPIGQLRKLLKEKTENQSHADHMDYQALENLLSKARRKAKKVKYADDEKQKYESEVFYLSNDLFALARDRADLLQMKLDLLNEIHCLESAMYNETVVQRESDCSYPLNESFFTTENNQEFLQYPQFQ